MAAEYDFDREKRRRRNIARANFFEHAPLMDRFVDPGYFGVVVRYQTSPDSGIARYEGHSGGLNPLARDIVRAALVPRRTPEPQSTIALHVLEGLAQLHETAKEGLYDYDPTLGYAFMRRTARNRRLSTEVQDRAAAYLTQYSQETYLALQRVLEQANQQDDSRAYTGEVWVEEWFGAIPSFVHLIWNANRLLDATEPLNKGASFSPTTIIPDQVRSALQMEMNRGLGYLCEISSLPPLERQTVNLTFLNLQNYFCTAYRSRHLLPVIRAHVEQLVGEVALDLADTLTGNYELDEDTLYYLGGFAEYAFLDLYFPGIVAELQACRKQWDEKRMQSL